MAVSFKGAHFPQDIILTGVRWYVAYPLSTRHVEELMEGFRRKFSSEVIWLPSSNGEIFGAKELHLTIQAVTSGLTKRPSNEIQRKCSKSWLKAQVDIPSTHLNKHRLINSLVVLIDETCPRRVDTQAVLPPKISPLLPGSGHVQPVDR
jgi:hypothetical protein